MTVLARVSEICCAALKRATIDPAENLTDAGADSLVAVEIITQIEIDYGVDLVELFFATPTITALVAAIEAHQIGASA